MDDLMILFCKAAKEGKLKFLGPDGVYAFYPPEDIEPTCISDAEETLQPALWNLHALLSAQIARERFWSIDEAFLSSLGQAIGDLMAAKQRFHAEDI